MQVEEITKEQYAKLTPEFKYVYMSDAFNHLNAYKVDEVKYLVFKDTKNRFSLVAGLTNNELRCPFSAPYGMINIFKKNTSIGSFSEAVKAVKKYCEDSGLSSLKITLPPTFYDEKNINKLMNSLLNVGAVLETMDLNFQIDLDKVRDKGYENIITYAAKKNLHISLKTDNKFHLCDCSQYKRAYEIIATNRAYKGYPLRMTFEQVKNTMEILKHDCFIVENNGRDVASAIVFEVNEDVAQVIYWGDIPNVSELKCMNFLSYNVIEYYKNRGFKYLDIGPSTEDGVPNVGLCDFKESIGCDISSKFTLKLDCKK